MIDGRRSEREETTKKRPARPIPGASGRFPSTRRYLAARRLPWWSSICSPVLLAAALRRRARRLRGGHPREESRWGRVGEQESMSGRGEREGSVVRPCPPRGGGPWGTAARPWRHGERGMAPGPSVATVRRKGKRRDRQEGPTVRSLTLFHFSFSDF